MHKKVYWFGGGRVGAHERAREDRLRGDLGSAKRRLASLVVTCGYDPVVCREIAEICIEMGDPLEAGRWLFLCVADLASESEVVQAALDRFVQDCNAQPNVIASRLPEFAKTVPPERLPPAVGERLAELGLPRPKPTIQNRRRGGRWDSTLDALGAAGCFGVLFLLGASTVIGFGVIVRAVVGWF